jgi:hypothetical protein
MARIARNVSEKLEVKKKSFLLPIIVVINLALTLYLYYKFGILK